MYTSYSPTTKGDLSIWTKGLERPIHSTVAGSVNTASNTSNTLLIHMGIWVFIAIVIQILTFPPQFSIDVVVTPTVDHLETWGSIEISFTEILVFSSLHLIYYKIYLQLLRPLPILPCHSFISEVNLIIGPLKNCFVAISLPLLISASYLAS